MNPSDLYDTCIDKKNRISEQITDKDFDENSEFMDLMM